MSELHGVETIELTAGTMAVTTIKTAVIGLVGTAPDASLGTCARITVGTELLDNLLSFEAEQPGRIGNQFKVIAVAAVPDNTMPEPIESSAEYHSGILTLTLGCDAEGVVTAKACDMPALLSQLVNSKIHLLPTEGQGVVMPFSVDLSGGEDEPFPLNTPVVMVGTNQLHRLGDSGTLKQALMDINDQRAALTIVVRVEADNDKARQRAAILDGMRVWSQSTSATELTPRVLIATGFSEDDAVAKELEAQANKLRAVAYVDCASMASAQEVVQRRQLYGARVELLRPRVLVTDKKGENRYMPYSARAAGLRARIDVEKGWWWSKSNQDIYNIIGVEQADEFILGEPNCQANLLNMENISTIIRRNGFKHWGNRLCTVDPQWRFESVRRSADVIEDSIQETVLLYSDRPLDRDIAEDIIGTINAYMRQLIGLKAIFGGEAWLDEELNTRESLAAGQLYINYDFGPKSPTERITLRVRVNKDYAIEEMTS